MATNIEPSDLQNFSGRYRHVAAKIESEISSLMSNTAAIQGDWFGASSSALQSLLSQIAASQQQLIDGLYGVANVLEQASNAYSSLDSDIKGAFEV
jgi:WXG100 family type VII secretion target